MSRILDAQIVGSGSRADGVDWTLHEADRSWMSRLFADRLAIEWQLDTYGGAEEQPSRRVSGEVVELRSVRCRQVTTEEGRVPVTGKAQLLPVDDTSGSWMHGAPPAQSEAGHGPTEPSCRSIGTVPSTSTSPVCAVVTVSMSTIPTSSAATGLCCTPFGTT
jgi:hypothetical protein